MIRTPLYFWCSHSCVPWSRIPVQNKSNNPTTSCDKFIQVFLTFKYHIKREFDEFKITIKPSVLDKRKISTHDSISAAIVSNDKIATVKNLKVSYTCT